MVKLVRIIWRGVELYIFLFLLLSKKRIYTMYIHVGSKYDLTLQRIRQCVLCGCVIQVKCALSNLAKREPEGHLFNQVRNIIPGTVSNNWIQGIQCIYMYSTCIHVHVINSRCVYCCDSVVGASQVLCRV